MLKAVLLVGCVTLGYFTVLWPLLGHVGQAVMTGLLAAPLFSMTLLISCWLLHGRQWTAFWIANIALTVIFGGLELHGLLAAGHRASRFGGYPLSADGHLTYAGVASLVLDESICVLSNLIGFCLFRLSVMSFELE